MKLIDDFRNSELAKRLIDKLHSCSTKQVRLMEFCGGHTVAIMKYGIRQLLPPTIKMLSGPGCPVCVTDNADLDKAIAISRIPGVILATFGDMLKVPGSRTSLQEVRSEGADIRVVYSTLDAIEIARRNPSAKVVFLGIGFETTAPTVAASIIQAESEKLSNYSVLSMHKLCPPAIRAILDSGEVNISGLICPGHVSAVVGSGTWDFIAREYGIPCVVSGFEPVDILQTIYMLIRQLEAGGSKVEIAYRRGVTLEGNRRAIGLMYQVFEPCSARWRGIGAIANSGLALKEQYHRFDAERVFEFDAGPAVEPKGCICGEVLRAVKTPQECKLFRVICTPANPIGPCMVSSEGSCAAHYLYGAADD